MRPETLSQFLKVGARMHTFATALGLLRAPIFVALLAAAVLILPGQSREIFQAIRETGGVDLLVEVARALAFVVLFSFALLGSCLLLIDASPPSRKAATDLHRRLLEALAFAVALIPALAVGLATVNIFAFRRQSLGWIRVDLLICGLTVTFLAGIVALLAYYDKLNSAILRRARLMYRPISRLSVARGLIVVGALIVFLNTIIVIFPNEFADWFGPVCVVLLFLTLLCLMSALLTYIYDRYQIPALALLAVAAVAWAIIGTNNNHQVRLGDERAPEPLDAPAAFSEWLQKRADLQEFAGRPYPVYLVTAEGGGLYAAAHAAWVLARIQDSCPVFARHVFAISGVSGGSLGAAVFSALTKAYPSPRKLAREQKCSPEAVDSGPMQKAVRSYLREDLLTPLLAAGLFPDFFQRFWPTPIQAFD